MDQGEVQARLAASGPLVAWTAALAMVGSLLVIAVALIVVTSVVRRWLTDDVIFGTVEIVEIATALAVFSFLPLCQARRGNVVVDTFTARLKSRALDRIDAFWDLVYAGVAALIAWQLFQGARDTIVSQTTSMMLGLPVGYAIATCAVMAAVLAVVAVATALRLLRGGR
jgi:TRAP-type C4-dicarboxylate transport system permease small subunit